MPKHQTKSQQVAAMLRQPPMPEARGQHGNVTPLGAMGILTEEELRHPGLYTELYRCKNQAMERDLMQLQAADHETLRARLRNQETFRKLASQASMIRQLLSQPELQHNENLRGLLRRSQLHEEEAKDLARPLLERLNEEMPQVVRALDLKDLEEKQANGDSAKQATGEPEDPPVMSKSLRRRRNRQRAAGQDTKSQASTA